MDKVIVYGLGMTWKKNRKRITARFDVVGYSDRNENYRNEYSDFLSCNHLANRPEDILICATWKWWPYMIQSLVDNYGIDESRIRLWTDEEDLIKREHYDAFFSYAQFGEDYVIARMLNDLGISFQEANYIELGTCNPIRHNNTVFLHRNGAKGLCVEANPDFVPAIRALRKGCIVLNRAVVGSDCKEKTLPFYIEKEGGMSSLDKEWIERCSNIQIVKTELVETITINECMEIFGLPCRVLSVDVEGYDEIVLRDIDYDKWAPNIICAETGGRIDVLEMMKSKGYEYAFGNGTNDIWVRKP